MGLLDGFGDMFGKMAAQHQEKLAYKKEYERMNNAALKREYERLSQHSGTEISLRKQAIKMIMGERTGR